MTNRVFASRWDGAPIVIEDGEPKTACDYVDEVAIALGKATDPDWSGARWCMDAKNRERLRELAKECIKLASVQ